MEIAKTPYKSVYMVVPKTKFSKFSKSVYMPIRIYDGPTLYQVQLPSGLRVDSTSLVSVGMVMSTWTLMIFMRAMRAMRARKHGTMGT